MSDKKVLFTISGSPIEIIDSWTHLWHVICQDCDDSLDINKCCNKLIVLQINSNISHQTTYLPLFLMCHALHS